jgi:hypothetical protein
MPSSRYADHRYAGATRGTPPTNYSNNDEPWAVGSVRVDGLTIDTPVSGVVPGRDVTYQCDFLPDVGQDAGDHLDRWRTLANQLTYAADVIVYDPPGTSVYYREQYDGPSSLVRIAPLQADHDATWTDGDPPPTRDSIHRARWAVVVGGESFAPSPDQRAQVTLETVTIAAADATGPATDAPVYETREAVVVAAERSGL